MHYLVRYKVEKVKDWSNFYMEPEGERGWAIVEAENEEALRGDLEQGREVEEAQPLLPAHEYAAIAEARRELDRSKQRFVDDPAGALREAREAVGRAMDTRGYSRSGGTESTGPRREVIEEYESTNVGESSGLEEMRGAFGRLSRILERLARV